MTGIVLEGFAGPGGWSTGLRMLDLPDHHAFGVEWDRDACLTAQANGHVRVQADVAAFDLAAIRDVWLCVMSAPCQAWSRAGRRRGILDQAAIFTHAQRVIGTGRWIPYADAGPLPAGQGDAGGTWHDARSPLVLEIIRWVLAATPRNIALEQVPDVLPFFRLIARWLESRGYSVWTGVLSAERYGVPQTRERAILIASLERRVSCPPATHTAYDPSLPGGGKHHGAEADLFGGGLLPWVSMAEALRWSPGGVVNTRGDRTTPGGNEFSSDRPSWALTEKVRSWQVRLQAVESQAKAARIAVEEAAALQSFPPGYLLYGSKSSRHRQVGDAVPPLLAAHVLATCLGVPAPMVLGGAA